MFLHLLTSNPTFVLRKYSTNIKSIGLQQFRLKTPSPNKRTSFFHIWPSTIDPNDFFRICAFLNAVSINTLPGYISSTNQPALIGDEISIISKNFHQSERATTTYLAETKRYVKELKAQSVVDNILMSAMESVVDEVNNQLKIGKIFHKYSEGTSREYAFQFDAPFLINGRADTSISAVSKIPMPTEDLDSLITMEREQDRKWNHGELSREIGIGLWPPNLQLELRKDRKDSISIRKITKSALCHDYPLAPLSCFLHNSTDPIDYPFLNFIIDNKSQDEPLNKSQMLLLLYNVLTSQARYRNLDNPSVGMGIVTDAYRWSFVVLQLNTLLFDEGKVRNVVWHYDTNLHDDKNDRPLNLEAYILLKNILRLAVNAYVSREDVQIPLQLS